MGLLSNIFKDHNKMKKTLYEVPQTRILEIRIQGIIMGSITSTAAASGLNIQGWDSSEDDWN